MTEPLRSQILETLVCELGRRPAGAPTIGEILPAVRSVGRDAERLIVTFDRTATDLVSAVADAERQCCSTISWELATDGTDRTTQLRIGATPAQLDAFESIFAPGRVPS
jgi:hypothetical protein